jgi:hypothetical protein
MKTAISLPEGVYRSAEALARRLGVSRSRLYATAVAELVAKYETDEITKRLDAVHGEDPPPLDPVLERLQSLSFPADEREW